MLASAADCRRARVFASVMRPGSASAGIQLAPRAKIGAAVDVEREAAAGGVGLGDEADVAEREPDACGSARRRVTARSWSGCGAEAGRPPERRVRRSSSSAGSRLQPAAGRGLAGRRRRRRRRRCQGTVAGGEAAERDVDVERDAAGVVRAAGRITRVDLALGADERDAAVDAERGEGDVPVPAEVALRLAQHVAVRDRAVAGVVGDRERLLGGLQRVGGAGGGAQDDLDAVLARNAARRPTSADERAEGRVGARAPRAPFRRTSATVSRPSITRVARPVARVLEAARQRPVAVGDPAQVVLVAAVVGVGDQAGGEQRRMHVARHGASARLNSPSRVGEGPGSGKVEHVPPGSRRLSLQRRCSVSWSKSEALGDVEGDARPAWPWRNRGRRWCGPRAVAPAKVSQSRLSEPIGSSMSIAAGMARRRRRRSPTCSGRTPRITSRPAAGGAAVVAGERHGDAVRREGRAAVGRRRSCP